MKKYSNLDLKEIRLKNREKFIKSVATFVAARCVAKGFELGRPDVLGSGLPKDWAEVKNSLPGFFGYPSIEDCEKEIRGIFDDNEE